jgi:protease secretion system outer membrane protein
LFAAIGATTCASLQAQGVGESRTPGPMATAYGAALEHDAEYRAARFELQSREQLAPIARAALLPTLSATYSESRVRGERESPNALGQDFVQSLGYSNPTRAVQLRTPLFNAEAYLRWRSSSAQVDSARSVFELRGSELLERLGTAYVQRLFAEEAVALAQAQVDAFRGQLDAAQRRFQGGEGTRTEAVDAAAALSLARAEFIEAGDQREISARALARIVGASALPMQGLADDLESMPLPLPTLQEWLDTAAARSAALAARGFQLTAARSDVQRSRAGHLPRLEFVASAVDARNESISTLNQKSRQYSAGVLLTIPLYSGGATQAGVAQSMAEAARTEAQLDSDREQLALDVRTQFLLTQSGQTKVQALDEALRARALGLESAQRGLKAGVRTTADVLEALRRVFEARRDLMRARYEVLVARLRLQTLAGRPPEAIVADIDLHLTGPASRVRSPETPP